MMPRLSEQFGLRPADVWALTGDELAAYLDAAAATDAAHARAETEARSHGY